MNFEKTIAGHVFKEKKGFSLIELLVAMVIMSVVSLAIYGVFSVSSRSYTTQGVTADVQQSVRAAMEVMLQDIFPIKSYCYSKFFLSISPKIPINNTNINPFRFKQK